MSGILAGLRVVDLSVARAGPTTVRQLAEFGADVVRVEMPDDSGSIVRDHLSSDYVNLHGNKRLLNLNLKHPRGAEAFRRLLATADVLVENFRPSVKRRLGIDYPVLEADFPRLVYGSISGYGQDGPRADDGAVDQIMQGFAGLMSVTGDARSGPMRAGIAVSDLAAGTLLTNGILAALIERGRSGQGQWVHVSLLEAVLSFLDFQAARWIIDSEDAPPIGNHHPTSTPMGMFEASDGQLNLAAPSDRLFGRLCSAIDAGHLLEQPDYATSRSRHENRERLKKELQEILKQRTRAEWIDVLAAAGVPCGPVNSISEAFADPQVRHLGITVPVEHPARGTVHVLRSPVTLSRSGHAPKTASPLAGQHTDEILGELGYSDAEIADLHADGAV